MKNSVLECTTYGEVLGLTKHNDWEVRLEAYQATGFTKEALDDVCIIRYEAYIRLGYTPKAFEDPSASIRLNAYRTLGFTEEALQDEDADIRIEAANYFHAQKLKKEYEKWQKMNIETLKDIQDEIIIMNSIMEEINEAKFTIQRYAELIQDHGACFQRAEKLIKQLIGKENDN